MIKNKMIILIIATLAFLAEAQTEEVLAKDIPIVHTPYIDGIYGYREWTKQLIDCTEPIHQGMVDLSGTYRSVSQAENYDIMIEQCGDRITFTGMGIIHDCFADQTYQGGIHDIDKSCPCNDEVGEEDCAADVLCKNENGAFTSTTLLGDPLHSWFLDSEGTLIEIKYGEMENSLKYQRISFDELTPPTCDLWESQESKESVKPMTDKSAGKTFLHSLVAIIFSISLLTLMGFLWYYQRHSIEQTCFRRKRYEIEQLEI